MIARMSIFIFDANALLKELTIDFADRAVTTPSVIRELRSQAARTRVSAYLASKKLRVMKPSKDIMLEVLSEAKAIGEIGLSETDIELAALALQLKKRDPIVLTDDYSLQNLLSRISIKFKKVGLRGIKSTTEYIFICNNCNRVYKKYTPICYICGIPLSRRISRKRNISGEF